MLNMPQQQQMVPQSTEELKQKSMKYYYKICRNMLIIFKYYENVL